MHFRELFNFTCHLCHDHFESAMSTVHDNEQSAAGISVFNTGNRAVEIGDDSTD